MGQFPKISVVAMCHNREQYVEQMIRSILEQNYPNLDLVIIDDGSTDKSWEIIQTYKDQLGYCEHIDTKTTSAQAALEYGFAHSTGDVMLQMSEKGFMLPGSLHTIGRVFAEYQDVEWVTSVGCVANQDGSIISISPIRKDLHEHLIDVPWNLQTESTIWRRSLWERIGSKWDNGLGWAADYGLWCYFFAAGAKLYHINTILAAYRKTPTANGVKNPGQYYGSAAKYRAWLRTHISKKELAYAALYSVLRYAKPILRNIPDTVYQHIPLLNHFCNEAVGFKDMHTLKRYKRNPFRTIYPR
ncbi:MAG: glycosyltransferase [Candidatus Adlerbacteria bacterium]|nr:glycosyltransferase [Candidatus Adlerbacteria bacterium]